MMQEAGLLTHNPVTSVFPTISVTSCLFRQRLFTAAGQLRIFTPFPYQMHCKGSEKDNKHKEKSDFSFVFWQLLNTFHQKIYSTVDSESADIQ